ncbi:complex I NDUFA9 subunit family protein [Natronomonas gomsonensis]|uniref:complex I NDUFA9 subunit family protein n=1 Tax=Natronomonas gomsonensis TaxID=1046043 RepID=UPI0015BEF240|nr:complex I NDUFA9 subunit family protein [Natronomonas gomsonensis]
MRILVVGGTGFIGENLCRELHRRGHDVTALSRSPNEAGLPSGVETAMGDVAAYDSIEAAFEGQDAVVNLVALSPLFRPKGGNDKHFEVHRDGTSNVVRAAEEHGVGKLVQMSALGADPDGNTAYIQSKGLAEVIVKESGLDWVIFRPSVVFGDGGEFVSFTKKLAPPYLTPLPGGGKTRFQPIWVGDIVPMLADALEGVEPTGEEESDEGGPTPAIRRVGDSDDGRAEEQDPHVGETYDIGGPEVLTLAEVAKLAHAADDKPIDVVPVPMALTKIGLRLADFVPGAPMGSDQYRSLQFDNTTDDNDIDAFGLTPADLTTLADYLGVDPETLDD